MPARRNSAPRRHRRRRRQQRDVRPREYRRLRLFAIVAASFAILCGRRDAFLLPLALAQEEEDPGAAAAENPGDGDATTSNPEDDAASDPEDDAANATTAQDVTAESHMCRVVGPPPRPQNPVCRNFCRPGQTRTTEHCQMNQGQWGDRYLYCDERGRCEDRPCDPPAEFFNHCSRCRLVEKCRRNPCTSIKDRPDPDDGLVISEAQPPVCLEDIGVTVSLASYFPLQTGFSILGTYSYKLCRPPTGRCTNPRNTRCNQNDECRGGGRCSGYCENALNPCLRDNQCGRGESCIDCRVRTYRDVRQWSIGLENVRSCLLRDYYDYTGKDVIDVDCSSGTPLVLDRDNDCRSIRTRIAKCDEISPLSPGECHTMTIRIRGEAEGNDLGIGAGSANAGFPRDQCNRHCILGPTCERDSCYCRDNRPPGVPPWFYDWAYCLRLIEEDPPRDFSLLDAAVETDAVVGFASINGTDFDASSTNETDPDMNGVASGNETDPDSGRRELETDTGCE